MQSLAGQFPRTLHSKDTQMQVQVNLKSVYGKVVAYPANDAARIFATIAGTTTLTLEALQKIKALGFDVEAVDPLTLSLA